MTLFKRINWTNTLFILLTPVAGILGLIHFIRHDQLHLQTVILAISCAMISGISITAGYHRLFSHRSYRAAWPIRLFFLLFGAAAFEGSVLEWATDHRRHHRYTDTDRDPYSIKKGFWYAHMGWLFTLNSKERDFSNVEDLKQDRLVSFQHRFFVPLGIIMGFLLPCAIASLWGDPWGGLLIGGALTIAFNHQATFCINSVSHVFGKQTYEQQSGRDNWVTAFFTYGEGFHNFHHQFASDYRNGVRFYHYDPSKWIISLLSHVGLTKDLKKASKEQIIRYRIRAHETQLLAQAQEHPQSAKLFPYTQWLRDRILQVAVHIDHLEQDYRAFKQEKIQYLKGRMADYQQHLQIRKQSLKLARQELKDSLLIWHKMVMGKLTGIRMEIPEV